MMDLSESLICTIRTPLFLFFFRNTIQKLETRQKNWTAYIFFHYLMRLFNGFTQGYLGEFNLSRLSEDVCYILIYRFLSDRNTNNFCPVANITLRVTVYSLIGIL